MKLGDAGLVTFDEDDEEISEARRAAIRADAYASEVIEIAWEAKGSADRAFYVRSHAAAADALEVAADAWEEADVPMAANATRLLATRYWTEAFRASHPKIPRGPGTFWYVLTDEEARRLAKANDVRLPSADEGRGPAIQRVRLTPTGPEGLLRRVRIDAAETAYVRRKRPWVWGIGLE